MLAGFAYYLLIVLREMMKCLMSSWLSVLLEKLEEVVWYVVRGEELDVERRREVLIKVWTRTSACPAWT